MIIIINQIAFSLNSAAGFQPELQVDSEVDLEDLRNMATPPSLPPSLPLFLFYPITIKWKLTGGIEMKSTTIRPGS